MEEVATIEMEGYLSEVVEEEELPNIAIFVPVDFLGMQEEAQLLPGSNSLAFLAWYGK